MQAKLGYVLRAVTIIRPWWFQLLSRLEPRNTRTSADHM